MKIGRNDPCGCGSGKKYKKCCLNLDQSNNLVDFTWMKLREADDQVNIKLMKFLEKEYPSELEQAFDEYLCYMDEDEFPMAKTEENIACGFVPWAAYHFIPQKEDDINDMTAAQLYEKKYLNRLSLYERKILKAAITEQFSYYQVMSTQPGKTVRLKDLFRGGEVTVYDRLASENLNISYVLLAKVVTVDDCSLLCGNYVVSMPPQFALSLEDIKYMIALDGEPITTAILKEYEHEIREFFIDACIETENQPFPKLQNTDGEDFILSKLMFSTKASIETITERLVDLNFDETKDEILERATYDQDGHLVEVSFPWLVKGNKKHKAWENTVYAHLTIKPKELIIEVNSLERAEHAKEEMSKRLLELATYKTTVHESLNDELDTKQHELPKSINLDDHPELKVKMDEMLKNHWHNWLDQPLPALNGVTPRKAAKNKEGRERLESLFAHFHASNLKLKENNLQQPPVDLSFLRHELGMSE